MIPHIINTRKVVTPGSITCVIFSEEKQIFFHDDTQLFSSNPSY